jgi:hypothetical protein
MDNHPKVKYPHHSQSSVVKAATKIVAIGTDTNAIHIICVQIFDYLIDKSWHANDFSWLFLRKYYRTLSFKRYFSFHILQICFIVLDSLLIMFVW